MPRRPVIIVLITIGYVASPIFILLQGSLVHGIPLFGPGSITARLFFTDIIILFIYPVVAVAVFSVRKWGWYLFIAGVMILIGYNVFVSILSPLYNYLLLILYNLALAVVAGLLFRKHVIAPYFNPRLRWWESEPRYRINISINIQIENENMEGDILDISSGGCYMELDCPCRLGKVYDLVIHCIGRRAYLKGKVMRVDSAPFDKHRYGLMFIKTTSGQKEQIDSIIVLLKKSGLRNADRDGRVSGVKDAPDTTSRAITKPRYITKHTAILEGQRDEHPCRILDISMHGCRLHTMVDCSTDEIYSLRINCMKYETVLEVKLNWKTMRQDSVEYGVSFMKHTDSSRQSLKKTLRSLKKIGARNRLNSATPVPDRVIDEHVTDSPYKAVLFFKRLMGK
jgi:hypothetical protein